MDNVLGKERKLHWVFLGCNVRKKQSQGGYMMFEVSEIAVNHYNTEKEALLAAKKILKRKYYQLKQVYECTQCQNLEEQKEVMKIMKKHLGQ